MYSDVLGFTRAAARGQVQAKRGVLARVSLGRLVRWLLSIVFWFFFGRFSRVALATLFTALAFIYIRNVRAKICHDLTIVAAAIGGRGAEREENGKETRGQERGRSEGARGVSSRDTVTTQCLQGVCEVSRRDTSRDEAVPEP